MNSSSIACLLAMTFVSPLQDEAAFRKLDANKNGVLDSNDFAEDQQVIFERLVAARDSDGDGRLTVPEFVARVRKRSDSERGTIGTSLFRELDTNRDGKVSRDEAPSTFSRLFEIYGKNELTEREIASPARSQFDVIDRNQDGVASRQEISESTHGPRLRDALRGTKRQDFDRSQFRELVLPVMQQRMLESARTAFSLMDRNKDGKTSLQECPDQLKRLLENFLRNTKQPADAEVTKDAWLEALKKSDVAYTMGGDNPESLKKQQAKTNKAPQTPPDAFVMLDFNRDGKLSIAELAAAASRLKRLDLNGDGAINLTEFIGRAAAPTKSPGQQPSKPRTAASDKITSFVERFFKQYDSNKDGTITLQELPVAIKPRLLELDGDADGKLIPAEMIRAARAMQQVRE